MTERRSIRTPLQSPPRKEPPATGTAARISRSLDPAPDAVASPPEDVATPVEAEPAPDFPDIEAVAERFVALIGREVVAPLAANPSLQVPRPGAADDDLPLGPVEWTAAVLGAFVTLDGLRQLDGNLRRLADERQVLKSELAQARQLAEEVLAQCDDKVLVLERRLADANLQVHRLQDAAGRSIGVHVLVEEAFGPGPKQAEISAALTDSLTQPSEALGPFIAALCLGWTEIKPHLAVADGDEDAAMERVAVALRGLLSRLSGHYIPERREVLRCIAGFVSERFTDYEFVSPEDWRHVDPAVHNVAGVGGQKVKEGLSFVVLKRGSRLTVMYADIVSE